MDIKSVAERILNAIYDHPQAGLTDAGDERFERDVTAILEEACQSKTPDPGAAVASHQQSRGYQQSTR